VSGFKTNAAGAARYESSLPLESVHGFHPFLANLETTFLDCRMPKKVQIKLRQPLGWVNPAQHVAVFEFQ
jgi:hypothetical protein